MLECASGRKLPAMTIEPDPGCLEKISLVLRGRASGCLKRSCLQQVELSVEARYRQGRFPDESTNPAWIKKSLMTFLIAGRGFLFSSIKR